MTLNIFFLCVASVILNLKLGIASQPNSLCSYIKGQKHGGKHQTKGGDKQMGNRGTKFKPAQEQYITSTDLEPKLEKESLFTHLSAENRYGIHMQGLAASAKLDEKGEKARGIDIGCHFSKPAKKKHLEKQHISKRTELETDIQDTRLIDVENKENHINRNRDDMDIVNWKEEFKDKKNVQNQNNVNTNVPELGSRSTKQNDITDTIEIPYLDFGKRSNVTNGQKRSSQSHKQKDNTDRDYLDTDNWSNVTNYMKSSQSTKQKDDKDTDYLDTDNWSNVTNYMKSSQRTKQKDNTDTDYLDTDSWNNVKNGIERGGQGTRQTDNTDRDYLDNDNRSSKVTNELKIDSQSTKQKDNMDRDYLDTDNRSNIFFGIRGIKFQDIVRKDEMYTDNQRTDAITKQGEDKQESERGKYVDISNRITDFVERRDIEIQENVNRIVLDIGNRSLNFTSKQGGANRSNAKRNDLDIGNWNQSLHNKQYLENRNNVVRDDLDIGNRSVEFIEKQDTEFQDSTKRNDIVFQSQNVMHKPDNKVKRNKKDLDIDFWNSDFTDIQEIENSYTANRDTHHKGKNGYKHSIDKQQKENWDEINLSNNNVTIHENVSRNKRNVNTQNVIYTCDTTRSCEYNDRLDVPNCYCDDQCKHFNDCCYLYNENVFSQEMSNTSIYEPNIECRIGLIPGFLKNSRGYWMVTKCPASYTKDGTVAVQCNATTNKDIPVTDENGIVYGNFYCAQRHGKTKITTWMIDIKADTRTCRNYFRNFTVDNQEILALNGIEDFRQKSCSVTYIPPVATRPRACYPFMLTDEERKTNALCTDFLNPVLIDRKYQYRNIYCVENWTFKKCLADGFPYDERSFKYPLSILFTLSQPLHRSNRPCKSDSQNRVCFPKECVGLASCQKSSEILFQNYEMTFILQLTSQAVIDAKMASRAMFLFWGSLPVNTYKFMKKASPDASVLYTSALPLYNNSQIHSVVNATYNLLIRTSLTSDQIMDLKHSVDFMDWVFVENSMSDSRAEIKMLSRQWNLPMIDQANITSTVVFMFSSSSNFDLFTNASTALQVPKSCNATTAYNVSGTRRFLASVDCNYENMVSNPEVNQSDFVFSDNTSYIGDGKTQIIQVVLTYVTLGLSSVAIVPSLIVHRYLGLTSMSSGHISENALTVLFLFNLIFMVGIGRDTDILCLFSAVTAHYLLLSFFLWVSLFVIQTMTSIIRLNQPQGLNSLVKTRFPRLYYVIGYVTPLLIVIPSLVIHACQCTSINISYHGPICFPTGYPANLVIFICPVLISVLVNVGCLCYSAWRLFCLSKSIDNVGIRNSRSYVSMYLRLCMASGLSWAVGVLSEFLDSDTLRYIFIVSSGLHGLLFCIAILCSRTFRDRFHEKYYRSSQQRTIEMNSL